jgi:hypothetical protein
MKFKNLLFTTFLIILSVSFAFSQPTIEWQKCLGGFVSSIQPTSDGGCIGAGSSSSFSDDSIGNHGSYDFWVVKLNSLGIIEWQKSLGGSGSESAFSIQQTSDGGYIVAGSSNSNDGDVSGNHGDYDSWVVKLNSIGIIEWQKSLGGSNYDDANSIQQTNDGGYIVAGYSNSNDGDVSVNYGGEDYWVVKLSNIGNIDWQKSYGGTDEGYPFSNQQITDEAFSIQVTNDGGYIVAGSSLSSDVDVSGNHGEEDYWIVKLNNTGIMEWQKSLGGTDTDGAFSIQQTNDGGYIVAGYTYSNDGDVSGNHGISDCWVVKLSSIGTIDWQKTYGGARGDFANSIELTNDGGYILAGYSNSNDGDVSGNHGDVDYWVLKITSLGSIEWQKSLGGSTFDAATSIYQTNDGGYIVTGGADSNDGDVVCNDLGGGGWLVKLTNSQLSIENSQPDFFSVFPNPAQNTINIKADNKLIGKPYSIYDNIGKVVLSGKINSENTVIEIGNLSCGIYTFSDGENKKQTFKVIKE